MNWYSKSAALTKIYLPTTLLTPTVADVALVRCDQILPQPVARPHLLIWWFKYTRHSFPNPVPIPGYVNSMCCSLFLCYYLFMAGGPCVECNVGSRSGSVAVGADVGVHEDAAAGPKPHRHRSCCTPPRRRINAPTIHKLT